MNYFADRPLNETDRNCPEDDSHRPQGDKSGTMQRRVSTFTYNYLKLILFRNQLFCEIRSFITPCTKLIVLCNNFSSKFAFFNYEISG